MTLRKTILTLLTGVILISCGRENTDVNNKKPEGISTYVTLSIALPSKAQTRDLPEDYNPDGVYEGNDGITTLDIYMMGADGVIEAKRFTGTDISSTGTIVSPSQPFRTTSGYKTVYVVLNDPNPLETTISAEDELVSTEGLASVRTVNGQEYDIITMTGKSDGQIYIEPDASIQDVLSGTNKIAIEVNRLASRVIVTSNADPTLVDENGVTLGTVSNVTWSVAQGTKMIYWLPQTGYVSYAYDYVPALGEYVGVANEYYDYSDLSTPSPVEALPVASDGYKSLTGKFLFENTHVEGDLRSTGYRKGNTAYVLVKATFTPDPAAIADGGTLNNGTFYVGQTDGLIYSNKEAALEAVQNQKVAQYNNGKMLNFAWLNPDDIAAPLNSPVVRNNIYHINITGYKRLGYTWNPLFPENPNSPTPQNPDPRPVNPDQPDTQIDPIDPLTPEQTHMTVDVTVLDWTVHSYDIEF